MDKFNDIWKNKFNDGDMPVGDWNTPDAEVWGNILPHVPEKKRRKGLWWWLSLTVLLVLIISYFSFVKTDQNFSSTINEVEMVIEPSSVLVKNADTFSTISRAKEKNTITENRTAILNPKINDNKLKSSSKNEINTFTPKKESTNLPIKKIVDELENNSAYVEFTNTNNTIVKKPNIKNEESSIVIEDEVVDRAMTASELVPVKSFLFKKETESLELPEDAVIKVIKTNPRELLTFGGRVGAAFWHHNISSEYQSDLEAFDFNYSNNTGWFVALDVQIPINKYLEVYSGLQYERVETTSGHNSELTYEVASEQGDRTNDYALNLATPYGASAASFKFNRDESFNDAAVNLLVDFNSSHTIQNLSIPVGLSIFPLGKQRRWMPSASLGFGTNYLMKISNAISAIDTNHDAIAYTKTGTSNSQAADINEWHFDLRVGMGLGYRITNNVQVNLNFNYSQGLNPIFEKENYNTKINRYNISIGVLKHLSK